MSDNTLTPERIAVALLDAAEELDYAGPSGGPGRG